jgi:hypothetical protein
MKITPLYIILGMLLVSAVVASGAMAEKTSPIMEPLISTKSVVSASYAEASYGEIAVEATEAISISDIGYGSLQVKPSYAHLQLQPDETGSAIVTISNRGDEDITIDPVMILQPYSENYLEEDWVTVTPSDVVLQPGDKEEFTVEVVIPDDAELGHYYANVVFDRSVITDDTGDTDDAVFDGTDSKISSVYYGNSLDLSVEVWIPPTVQISTNYINGRVQAGEEYDYSIKLVNTGDEDISIGPELISGELYPEISYYDSSRAYYEKVIGKDSIVIDAPEEVKAGETAVVNVHVQIPEGTAGSYSTTIDLGIDDPALDEWENQVNFYLDIWEQPSEPLVRQFSVNRNSTVMIELSAEQYSYSDYSAVSGKPVPSFDVVLNDDGKEIELKLINTVSSGSVNFGNNNMVLSSYPPIASSSGYQEYSTTYTEIYEAVGVSGECELSILSHNTDNFDYSITSIASE